MSNEPLEIVGNPDHTLGIEITDEQLRRIGSRAVVKAGFPDLTERIKLQKREPGPKPTAFFCLDKLENLITFLKESEPDLKFIRVVMLPATQETRLFAMKMCLVDEDLTLSSPKVYMAPRRLVKKTAKK